MLGFLASGTYFLVNGWPWGTPTTYCQNLIGLSSVTYFIADFIIEVAIKTIDYPTFIHHVIAIVLGGQFYWNQYGGIEVVLCIFLAEISNPFLVLRTLFKLQGDKKSGIYFINELIFMISFLIVRVFIGPFVIWHFFEYE